MCQFCGMDPCPKTLVCPTCGYDFGICAEDPYADPDCPECLKRSVEEELENYEEE